MNFAEILENTSRQEKRAKFKPSPDSLQVMNFLLNESLDEINASNK